MVQKQFPADYSKRLIDARGNEEAQWCAGFSYKNKGRDEQYILKYFAVYQQYLYYKLKYFAFYMLHVLPMFNVSSSIIREGALSTFNFHSEVENSAHLVAHNICDINRYHV